MSPKYTLVLLLALLFAAISFANEQPYKEHYKHPHGQSPPHKPPTEDSSLNTQPKRSATQPKPSDTQPKGPKRSATQPKPSDTQPKGPKRSATQPKPSDAQPKGPKRSAPGHPPVVEEQKKVEEDSYPYKTFREPPQKPPTAN